jgi:serine/threonine protein phosphatase PrpC
MKDLQLEDKNNLLFSFSLTPKAKNEDFHITFKNSSFSGVIVADGVGSYSRAREASKRATELLKEKILSHNENSIEKSLYQIFNDIEEDLNQLGEDNECIDCYATTLLLVIKLKTKIVIAYLGNGAILHIRNSMSKSKMNQLLSWGITNYLIPHTVKNRDGKESLYRFLSSNREESSSEKITPTVLTINREYNGDIFLLCTDGFYSNDQITIGKINKTGETLSVYDKKYIDVLNIIEDFYKNNSLLQTELEQYLEEIREKLDDDTTIGILIDSDG